MSEQEQAAPPQAKQPKQPTVYVVLQASSNSLETWSLIGPGEVTATSAEAAITQVAESRTEGVASGAYVAVPLRSFKPVSVVVESKPSVQIGELA